MSRNYPKNGNQDAKLIPAYMYQKGLGVDQDKTQAMRYAQNAPNIMATAQSINENEIMVVLSAYPDYFDKINRVKKRTQWHP